MHARYLYQNLGYFGWGWLPVHGGITYAGETEDGGYIYGFDCAHSMDFQDDLLFDIDWLSEHCEDMGRAIEIASKYESKFRKANKENRLKIAHKVRSEIIEKCSTCKDEDISLLTLLGMVF